LSHSTLRPQSPISVVQASYLKYIVINVYLSISLENYKIIIILIRPCRPSLQNVLEPRFPHLLRLNVYVRFLRHLHP